MRKGSALPGILVIVAAVVVFAFFAPQITCLYTTCNSGPQSSNDIITISFTSLNPKNPQPNTNVIWQMDLNNNAGNDHFEMGGVWLHFFPGTGLEITNDSLDCRGGTKTSDVDCIFNNFFQFETRTVFLTMRVQSLPSGIPLLFKYFVNYDYNSNNRSVTFPIIGNSLSQPTENSFFHQDPTPAPVNPVSLNYVPDYNYTRVINGQTINDYWARSGQNFTMTLNFKLATSTWWQSKGLSCEKPPCENATIPTGKLKIDFTQSSNFIKLNYCTCAGSSSSSCFDVSPETPYGLVSNQPIIVSRTVTSVQCSFFASITSPEETGRIETSYDVNYQFENEVPV